MQQPNSPDIALENLCAIRSQVEEVLQPRLTESDTRCKVIDRILKEVIGWDEAQIHREEYEREHGKFIDYVLNRSDSTLIVEAKRSGETFDLPLTGKLAAGSHLSLSSDKKLEAHLSQAVSYAQHKDAPIAVLSNGPQWILVDCVWRTQGRTHDTVVIRSLEELVRHISLFWAILSPFGVGVEALRKAISGQDSRRRPAYQRTLLESLYDPNEVIQRNPISDRLQPLLESYFGDLIHRMDLLAECYCETGRQAQHSKEIQSLLRDRIPNFGAPIKAITVKRKSAEPFQEDISASLLGQESGRLILLLGGVGVGKTTFLHRFFHNILDESVRDKSVWLYVDFLRLSTQDKEIAEFIATESLNTLENRYSQLKLSEWERLQEIYESELSGKRRGVWRPLYEHDRKEYELRVSTFLEEQMRNKRNHLLMTVKLISKRLGLAPIIILDNPDQLDAETQKQAFLEALSISTSVPCTVILTLREETYSATRDNLPFDTHQSLIYHVTAPDLASVFRARLNSLRTRHEDTRIELEARQGARVSGVSAVEFFDMIINSIQNNSNSLLLFDCLSANDIRQALEMFRAFLTSGHTNTDEFIRTYLTSGYYSVPFHALVRSLSLRDRQFYSTNETYLCNLFAYSDDGSYFHTTKLKVLRRLMDANNDSAPAGKGFVSVERLFAELSERILDEARLRSLLDSLARSRLVQGDEHGWSISERDRFVKGTAAAAFYLKVLVSDFSYLDQVVLDTPIKQVNYYNTLSELTERSLKETDRFRKLKLRLDRVETFLSYLKSEEQKDEQQLRSLGTVDVQPHSEIKLIQERFSEQKQEILDGASRRFSRARN